MKKILWFLVFCGLAWLCYRYYYPVRGNAPAQKSFALADEHQQPLNQGGVSEQIRELFRKNGSPLSDDILVEVKEKDKEWLLQDKRSGREYVLVQSPSGIQVSEVQTSTVELLDEGEETNAVGLYKKGKFAEALEHFAQDLSNPRNLAYSAMCFAHMRQTERAAEFWNRLIRDFPESPYISEAYYRLAQDAKKQDMAATCRENLEKAASFYETGSGGGKAALELGNHALSQGNEEDAWKWYSMAILGDFGKNTRETKKALKAHLDILSQKILFSSKSNLPIFERYEVQSGDSLTRVGKRYRLEPGLIRWLNKRKSDDLRVREQLKLLCGPVGIQVGKNSFLLVVHLSKENHPPYYIMGFEVGLGKDDRTPVNVFRIEEKIKEPAWYWEGRRIPYGSPENVLGTRWMAFEEKDGLRGFGIHGTSQPDSIGKNMSNGCVRMRNEDVEALFEVIPRGTAVSIRTN